MAELSKGAHVPDLKIAVDPVYLQVLANLEYLKAAVPSDNSAMEHKRQEAIKVLSEVEYKLKSIYCGIGMGIFVSYK